MKSIKNELDYNIHLLDFFMPVTLYIAENSKIVLFSSSYYTLCFIYLYFGFQLLSL